MGRKILFGALAPTAIAVLAGVLYVWSGSPGLSTGSVSAQKLAGSWKAKDGAAIEFSEDGAFCSHSFPIGDGRRTDSCGTWELGDSGTAADQAIDLHFNQPKKTLTSLLRVSGEQASGGLYFTEDIDDPGNSVKFQRSSLPNTSLAALA